MTVQISVTGPHAEAIRTLYRIGTVVSLATDATVDEADTAPGAVRLTATTLTDNAPVADCPTLFAVEP